MSHLHGGIESGLLDEQGCVDDGYLVIEVGSTSHQRKRGLATHQSYLDVDSVDQEFILQKHIHVETTTRLPVMYSRRVTNPWLGSGPMASSTAFMRLALSLYHS